MGQKESPNSTAGLPISCRAAVIRKPGEKKFSLEQVTVAPPRKDQVRIKILYTSICHTDVTMMASEMLPLILGHESAGVVESVGEGVTRIQVGDHVLPFMLGQCDGEQCISCKDDRSNYCQKRKVQLISPNIPGDDTPHYTTEDGKIISRLFGLSTFSEYIVVNKDNVVKISTKAPLEKACLLSCGVGTGLGAAWKVAKVKPDSTVAVFGLGTVGLAVAEGCRVAGASRIIGIDINPDKFVIGKAFGITDFINPKDHQKPVAEVIAELTGGGVDYSFECVGNAKVLTDAIECTIKEWGMVVLIGYPTNPRETTSISPLFFLYGRKLVGTSMGGLTVHDLGELVERSIRKEFQLDLFATHSLPFSKINEALEIFHSGDCLRCVLHMGS